MAFLSATTRGFHPKTPSLKQNKLQINTRVASRKPEATYNYTYEGSDGRKKAAMTPEVQLALSRARLRHIDSIADRSSVKQNIDVDAPWSFISQVPGRLEAWTEEFKIKLLKRSAADELGWTGEELEAKLTRLQTLLPDIQTKLAAMKPETITSLVTNIDSVATYLIQLKSIFPGANASVLATRQPNLVLGFDMKKLEHIATQLRTLLPKLDIDKLVESEPSILDIDALKEAMEEARRIMPYLDIQTAMASDPQKILSFQKGNRLIPYDPPTPTADKDNDEYSAYYE